MKNIEVEVRGKIANFEALLDIFRQKAKFVRVKDRISLIYLRHDFQDVRNAKDDSLDLRLRVTNKTAEIMLKYGQWGTEEAREESSIPISLDDFEKAASLLKNLGWFKGIALPTKTFVFEYNGVEFSLVNGDRSYFEAGVVVNSEEEIDGARTKIFEACENFGLKTMPENEFIEMINYLNSSSYKFDLSKQEFSEIKEKFRDYF